MEKVIGGKTYTTNSRLDAFTQLHIARKLGPAIPILEGIVDIANLQKDKAILTVLMFSHISDADTEYVIGKCLGVVYRQQDGGKPAKIQTPQGALMFDDIDMHAMLELAVEVIEENLGDFFRTSLANMEQAGKKSH